MQFYNYIEKKRKKARKKTVLKKILDRLKLSLYIFCPNFY